MFLKILFLIPFVLLAQNPYLDEFNNLPDSYKQRGNTLINNGEKLLGDEFKKTRLELVTKYSWAVPTDEAINAIAGFSKKDGLIDFGAGTGYWAKLISDKGVDVIAVDNWTDGKPKLWFDVKTGSYEYLKMANDRVLFMCWIPQYTDMGLTALRTWNGNKFIMVGEPSPARSNANPAFFNELEKNWELLYVIEIPQWYNHNDAVYFYKRVR